MPVFDSVMTVAVLVVFVSSAVIVWLEFRDLRAVR